MKTLTLFLLMTASLFGASINESLLKVHATLIPKISIMDYKFKQKIKNDSITIAIVYKNNNFKDAQSLKNKIDTRYKNGIKSYKVESEIVTYADIKQVDANIYYLFPSNEEDIKHSIEQADKHNALTFSYLEDDLQYGVMVSLNISKKIKPILNLDAIRIHNISFRPVLIDISSIYKRERDSDIKKLKERSFSLYNKIYRV